jgi:hypothetical protein
LSFLSVFPQQNVIGSEWSESESVQNWTVRRNMNAIVSTPMGGRIGGGGPTNAVERSMRPIVLSRKNRCSPV